MNELNTAMKNAIDFFGDVKISSVYDLGPYYVMIMAPSKKVSDPREMPLDLYSVAEKSTGKLLNKSIYELDGFPERAVKIK